MSFIAIMFFTTIVQAQEVQVPREFSFDLWDWTAPCRDLGHFRVWAKRAT